MISVNMLLELNIDPIPKYRLLRDVIRLSEGSPLLAAAKEDVLQTEWVRNILALQQSNGSWGYFHSLGMPSKNRMTTEQALRRLRIMGLDSSDLCIQKAVAYMERFLNDEEEFPDRKEKLHDWTIFTQLMAAAQIKQFCPTNKSAVNIANRWKGIIEYAFSGCRYSQKRYEEAYSATFFMKPKGGRLTDFVNFYPLTLLSGLVEKETERKLVEYVIYHTQGIYYIYDKRLCTLPREFASKEANRYLYAIELLSQYTYAKEKLLFAVDWIMKNIGEDGFWDMGMAVKDGISYPMSNSWRNKVNRKIDCTVRVLSLLSNINDAVGGYAQSQKGNGRRSYQKENGRVDTGLVY